MVPSRSEGEDGGIRERGAAEAAQVVDGIGPLFDGVEAPLC